MYREKNEETTEGWAYGVQSGIAAGTGRIGFFGRLFAGLVAMNRVEHFAAVDRHFLGRFYPKANFVPADFDDDDCDVIVDDNTFVLLAG